MAKTTQILNTYNDSKIKEKNAPAQKVDFFKPKVGGSVAVKGFTPKALSGMADYNLDTKVLEAARKGKMNGTPYTSTIKR